jgi:hypothetical protein
MNARCAIRITITSRMLEHGEPYLNDWGLRTIRRLLGNVPKRAPVTIDLGWLTRVDYGLVSELAVLPCQNLTFEAADWQVALQAVTQLNHLLDDRQVA